MKAKILFIIALLLILAQGTWGAIAVDGKLPGAFSVSATKQVWFSQGNLQYQANSTGATEAPYTGVWRFATNQYEAIGSGNSNVSASYDGWIDSFGWGSGNQPTQTSEASNVYSTFVDWGTNAISNGGNTANLWRTLSESEWTYLVFTRPNASSKRGRATINGMYCFVLLPDDWVLPSGLSFTPDANNWTNEYTTEQWIQMEDAGAVCFPAAGSRAGGTNNTNVNDYNRWCCYWSSTSANSSQGYNLWITSDHVGTTDKGNYQMGASVRLVSETMFPGSGTEEVPYLISSEAAWNYLADQVNGGTNYSGKYFQQTGDFTVSSKIIGHPTDDTHYVTFNGIYDGNGRTITASISKSDERYVAPFHCIANATIKNVIVTGSVTVSGSASIERRRHPAGLVGVTDGTCILQNCRVSANVSGCDYMGGLIGHTQAANITITGCVYSGTLTASDKNNTGGLIGWGGDNGGKTYTLTNNLFAGSYSGSGQFHPVGFLYNPTGNTRTVTNTYYMTGLQNVGDDNGNSLVKGLANKGKFAYSITAGSDVTISGLGASTATYNASGITAYTHGIKYGSTYYAGNGEEVSLTLSHADKAGYTFNQYTVTGGGSLGNPTTNTPTLTMTDANQTINAEWLENTATLSQATDNSTFISANNGLVYDITLGRTMNAGGWNTFAVPFDINPIPTGWTVKKLTGASNDGSTLTLTFGDATSIEAGKPYLVKVDVAAENPTFDDVTIAEDSNPTTVAGVISFVPVINPTAMTAGDKTTLFVTTGNKLTYPNTTGNINGFRAYFQLPSEQGARQFVLNFGEGDPTVVFESEERRVKSEESDDESWYDLSGRKYDSKPTKPGVYVHKGEKVSL